MGFGKKEKGKGKREKGKGKREKGKGKRAAWLVVMKVQMGSRRGEEVGGCYFFADFFFWIGAGWGCIGR